MKCGIAYRRLGFIGCLVAGGEVVPLALKLVAFLNGRRTAGTLSIGNASHDGFIAGLVVGLVLLPISGRLPLAKLMTVVFPTGLLVGCSLALFDLRTGVVGSVFAQATMAFIISGSQPKLHPCEKCFWCGYDLRGLAARMCPECGKATIPECAEATRKCPSCVDQTMDDAGRCLACGFVDETLYRAAVRADEGARPREAEAKIERDGDQG